MEYSIPIFATIITKLFQSHLEIVEPLPLMLNHFNKDNIFAHLGYQQPTGAGILPQNQLPQYPQTYDLGSGTSQDRFPTGQAGKFTMRGKKFQTGKFASRIFRD